MTRSSALLVTGRNTGSPSINTRAATTLVVQMTMGGSCFNETAARLAWCWATTDAITSRSRATVPVTNGNALLITVIMLASSWAMAENCTRVTVTFSRLASPWVLSTLVSAVNQATPRCGLGSPDTVTSTTARARR